MRTPPGATALLDAPETGRPAESLKSQVDFLHGDLMTELLHKTEGLTLGTLQLGALRFEQLGGPTPDCGTPLLGCPAFTHDRNDPNCTLADNSDESCCLCTGHFTQCHDDSCKDSGCKHDGGMGGGDDGSDGSGDYGDGSGDYGDDTGGYGDDSGDYGDESGESEGEDDSSSDEGY
jgi:hypothetical protein